jgi:hypothetical protein
MRARASTRPSSEDGHLWLVIDDLARDCPVTPAELDAVEAFLMPLVRLLLADRTDKVLGVDSETGQARRLTTT